MVIVNWREIESLYAKGESISRLSLLFKVSRRTIYNNIRIKENRHKHIKNRLKKETEKLLLKESKKVIKDLDFIKRNRSMYITNRQTGNIILKKNIITGIDVPIKWENKF